MSKLSHFNALTPAQAERLALVSEEAGEIVQAVGKCQRHGLKSNWNGSPTNDMELAREIGDLLAAVDLLMAVTDISIDDIEEFRLRKIKTVAEFLHHKIEDR